MTRIKLAEGGVADQLLEDLKRRNSPFAPAIAAQQNMANFYDGAPRTDATPEILQSMGGALAGMSPTSDPNELLSKGFAGAHTAYANASQKDETNRSNAMKLRIAIADTYKKVEEMDYKRELQQMKQSMLGVKQEKEEERYLNHQNKLYEKAIDESQKAAEQLGLLTSIAQDLQSHRDPTMWWWDKELETTIPNYVSSLKAEYRPIVKKSFTLKQNLENVQQKINMIAPLAVRLKILQEARENGVPFNEIMAQMNKPTKEKE